MFNEHPTIDTTTFEKGVITAFWNRADGLLPDVEPEPDDACEIMAVYRRLKHHFRHTSDVHLAFEINESEAWLGVCCSRYGIGLFYRIDTDGSRHVWSSVNGKLPNVDGYETQMRRIRSVFGEPWKITEHQNITARHIVNRLLNGPGITSCISMADDGTSDVA